MIKEIKDLHFWMNLEKAGELAISKAKNRCGTADTLNQTVSYRLKKIKEEFPELL